MADTLIALPRYGVSSGEAIPIAAVDLGDGTFALGVSNGTSSASSVAFPAVGGAGASVPFGAVLVSTGIYALKTQT